MIRIEYLKKYGICHSLIHFRQFNETFSQVSFYVHC